MNTLANIILILGLVNVLRLSALFLGSCWYDFEKLLNKKKYRRYFQPVVTVIITAFNEEKVIERCLASVYRSSYRHLEVIIANDGSKDRTLQIVHHFKHQLSKEKQHTLHIVTTKNGGKARILNHVLQGFVHSPLVMVLDADSILSSAAIENGVKYFQESQVAALASNVRILKQPQLLSLIQYIEYVMGHHMKKAYTSANNEYIIGGIGSMFRLSILKKVNYFDTNTLTEDIDLSMKILAEGNKKHRVVFGSDVVCFTEPVTTLSGLFRQRFRWKYGRFQTLFKQKHLFFNVSSKYTKLLTFVQLPFVIYSEISFLFDPLFLSFILYLFVKYQDLQTLSQVFLFFSAFTAGSIISDEYTTLGEKLILILLSPLAYLFFFIISIVEYLTLLKCVIHFPNLLKLKEVDNCAWVPVERIG